MEKFIPKFGNHATLEEALAAINGPFLQHQVKYTPRSAEEAVRFTFNAIDQMADMPLNLLITPGIDVTGCTYFYMGIRFDRNQIDVKVPVNPESVGAILAYISGAKELPKVENFQPEMVAEENREAWKSSIEAQVKALGATRKESVEVTNQANYVKVSYRMKRGKVTFNRGRVENLIDLLRN